MRDSLASWQSCSGQPSPGKVGGLGLGWLQTPVSHRSLLCFPGGADKNVIVFDKSSEQILATLKGHSKKVTSVVFHPSQVRSGSRSASSLTARLPQIRLSGLSSGALFQWALCLHAGW